VDRLHGLLMFLNVVETRSFSATARALGVSTSAVSATIIRLEQKLSVRLLNRTTRSVSPTPEGAEFYDRCKRIVAELEAAEAAVSQAGSTPAGKLLVGMPSALGRMYVIPNLMRFTAAYPKISIEIVLDDFISGIVSDGLDAAIQVGDLPPSSLTVRKLATVDYVLCASPSYLEARGHPLVPEDLDQHHCVTYRRPRNGQIRQWRLQGTTPKDVPARNGLVTVNSGEGLIAAAVSGLGIVQVARYYAQPLLNTGALVEVLPDYRTQAYDISVIFQPTRRLAPRLRAFIDFLVDIFAPPPWEETNGPSSRPAGRESLSAAQAAVSPPSMTRV
jgi:LysR family transcriptional regulator, regulator for bpeEF and oprC